MNGSDPSALAAYVSTTALLVLTPGSTTAVVIRNTLAGGGRYGLATAAGAAVGNTVHAVAAGVGLAWLLQRWPAAVMTLRLAGAAYLAWLGLSSLVQAWRGNRSLPIAPGGSARAGSAFPGPTSRSASARYTGNDSTGCRGAALTIAGGSTAARAGLWRKAS